MSTNSLAINTQTPLRDSQSKSLFTNIVHNYLKSEFDKQRDLKIIKEKLSKTESPTAEDKEGSNMIYRFKYESNASLVKFRIKRGYSFLLTWGNFKNGRSSTWSENFKLL